MTITRAAMTVVLALGLLASPLVGDAQQPGKVYRLGYLSPATSVFDSFRQALRELGLFVLANPTFFDDRRRLVMLAAKHRVPTLCEWREMTEAGCLMSYGPNILDLYRRVATYVDRIARGANPADLPIEQPTKFELVINLETAKALGLTIPPSLQLQADQAIQ